MTISSSSLRSSPHRNLLVTGSHRSGTTWLGKVLAASGKLDYLHEPFNLDIATKYDSPVQKWYEYVGNDRIRKMQFEQYIENFINGSLSSCISRIKNEEITKVPTIVLSEVKKFSRRRKPKLIKDPLALFSAEFFSRSLDYNVVVTIRHPAAFAESLKAKNWRHDFSHFLSQKELMDVVLPEFKEEIEYFSRTDKRQINITDQAILLWRLTHARILYYKKKYKNWLFVKHESLSVDPFAEFEKIFQFFELPFNNHARTFLERTTGGTKTTGERRDSRKNVKKWTRKLSQREIALIHEKTSSIAEHFYGRSEWFDTI